MANSIQSFIDNFNGGNRSHRYDVELDWPTSVDVSGTQTSSQLDKFHVRSVGIILISGVI